MEKKIPVDCIYTDFSKAFDVVNHNLLISKLKLYGINGMLLKWFANYLTNRAQYVKYRNFISDKITVMSGVPQGSHLGPLLFIIFINDITDVLLNVEYLMFADDLKIFKAINSSVDISDLQNSLNLLITWCTNNKLILNFKKCKTITFTRSKSITRNIYKINDIDLENVTQIRDLGVIFDSEMSFTPHIDYIANKSMQLLGFIKRNCQEFKSVKTLKLLYVMLVKSILIYASTIWSPIYDIHIKRLETIQHKFFRLASLKMGLPDPFIQHDYAVISRKLNIPSLESARKLNGVKFTYKLIKGEIDCPLLLGLLNFRIPTVTRNNDIFLCKTYISSYTENNPINRICKFINDKNIDILTTSETNFQKLCKRDVLEFR